jgi:aspartyl-tRNA(Asn)/glutamyl-tRNA(Gln) amidotransferase subunit B
VSQQLEAVIGLEIHVQLKTKSKMFCRCDNDSDGAEPNAHVCPVCLGMPGTLPVPNRTAIEWSLQTALALDCVVPPISSFDRKQYFYPDLPKGYQITQYAEPLGGPGAFEFDYFAADGQPVTKKVRITRLHLEEDAGKLTHPKGADYSLVDLNRAGTPLMEIVTEPDLRSPVEAKVFLQQLRLLMRHLGVSEADMEKGHLRADANVSVRPAGSKTLGTKTELKNLNSFKFVERGLASEIDRQTALLKAGEAVAGETRGFVEATGQTVSQRSKEESSDYRYFPEPDLPPLEPAQLGIDRLRDALPERPIERVRRWRAEYPGLPDDVYSVAIEAVAEAAAFDELLAKTKAAPTAAKLWLALRSAAPPAELTEFITEVAQLVEEGRLAAGQAKTLLAAVRESKQSVSEILTNDPAFAPADEGGLQKLIEAAVKAHPAAAADYRGGNENSRHVLVGAVMKASKGSANPTTVARLVTEYLEK